MQYITYVSYLAIIFGTASGASPSAYLPYDTLIATKISQELRDRFIIDTRQDELTITFDA